MLSSPAIRKIFEDVPQSTVKRILAGRAARVVLVEDALYIFARNFEEMILVEPRLRPGGELDLTYSLRDDAALDELLDRLGMSK